MLRTTLLELGFPVWDVYSVLWRLQDQASCHNLDPFKSWSHVLFMEISPTSRSEALLLGEAYVAAHLRFVSRGA